MLLKKKKNQLFKAKPNKVWISNSLSKEMLI